MMENDKNTEIEVVGEVIEKALIEESDKENNNTGKKKKHLLGAGTIIVIALIVATIVVFFLGAYFSIDTVLNKSVINVLDTYEDAKQELREDIQQKAAEFSESYYHVSNEAFIQFGNMKKITNLQVLKVSASEICTQTGNELESTLWLKVTESCEFIVDLTAADFIVDSERKMVVVRTPAPEPRNFALVETKEDTENSAEAEELGEESKKSKGKENLFSYSTVFSGDNITGRELLDRLTKEADEKIKNKIIENQDYHIAAKESATKIITNDIRALNPDVDGLIVVVEFIE